MITGRTIVVVPVWMTAFCTCPDIVTAIDGAFFGGVWGGIVMVVVNVVAASTSSSSPEMVTGFTASSV